MTRHILGLALASILTATIVHAQSEARKGVDLAKFQERNRDRVMQADSDHDGRISQPEFAAWLASRAEKQQADARRPDPEKRFRRLDANGDGFLTPDEIDAVSAKRFARLDADHDGNVTRDERGQMRKP